MGLLTPYCVGLAVSPRLRRSIAVLWFSGCCHIAGVEILARGIPSRRTPTLFTCNHVSYLDIPVLGLLGDGVFVAKSEVASWPFIGFIAKLGRTVFVARSAQHAKSQAAALRRHLAQGTNLFLFPEGTSSRGTSVLPFKSALFEAAANRGDRAGITVQPVSVFYSRLRCGRALNSGLEDLFAWHGDMSLLPHLWHMLRQSGAIVEVTFLEPVPAARFESRKALARHCHEQVSEGLAASKARRAYRHGRSVFL